jgi:methionine-rich copper-binding protein CopC
MLRKTKAIGVGAIVVLAAVSVVSAHMALKKSMPEEGAVLSATPNEIHLWFTQEPDPAVSRVSLAGPSGDVEIGETSVTAEKSLVVAVPALGSGTYVVTWRTAGDDGHVQRGDFSFTVQTD